jgi:hypothetical protein
MLAVESSKQIGDVKEGERLHEADPHRAAQHPLHRCRYVPRLSTDASVSRAYGSTASPGVGERHAVGSPVNSRTPSSRYSDWMETDSADCT